MSPMSDRAGAVCRITAVAAIFAVLGCQDAPVAGALAPEPPPASALQAGLLSGRVDADGSVSFDPVESGGAKLAPGVNAAIYGDQNVTVRLYSSDFAIDSTSVRGKKRWTFSVGLRNYLDYPIGSNQGGAQPDDTLGVYVVLVADPVVTSTSGPCSGSNCKIKVDSTTDGVGNFTAPGQKYYYWRERLAARQPVAGADTTSVRKRWVFTGPSAITGFRFVLMVSAAWPPPHDASWHVYYDGATDSLPDTQAEPRWKQRVLPGLLGITTAGSETWSSAGLVMKAASGANLYMYRADSLAAAESAYIEGRLSVNGSGSTTYAGVAFGLIDPERLIAVGVADGRVGFVNLAYDDLWILGRYNYRWQFVGSTYALQGNGGRKVHTYRLRKFGADSVRLEIDGSRVLGMRRSQLPPKPDDSDRVRAFFGVTGYGGAPTSTWSHLTYNYGTTQP